MSRFLERLLAFHSSPAICGIKAANLISLDYYESLQEEIGELNLKYPNICLYTLQKKNNKVLLLVFRKKVLEKHLFEDNTKEFLTHLGYNTSSIDSMLEGLVSRMELDAFPHEVGVFLGYSLEDIKAFMDGHECLYVGYWKVYSDVEAKKELFERFTRCRDCVTKLVKRGYSLENFMK